MTAHIAVRDLHELLAEFTVIDVRARAEWDTGHIAGAQLHPLNGLRASMSALDHAAPIAVHCKGGYRSTIACSLLEAAGFQQVMNVAGGFDAWAAAGLPV
jgi:hydroxyacylglutathione hydrolase